MQLIIKGINVYVKLIVEYHVKVELNILFFRVYINK